MSSGCFNVNSIPVIPISKLIWARAFPASPLVVQGHPRNFSKLKLAGKGGFVVLGSQFANNGFL